MQVLSQLSYNPTIGPLIGAIPDARPVRFLPDCSAGEFRVLDRRLAPSRLAFIEACAYCSRVNAFGRVYRRPSQTLKNRR